MWQFPVVGATIGGVGVLVVIGGLYFYLSPSKEVIEDEDEEHVMTRQRLAPVACAHCLSPMLRLCFLP